MRMCVPGRRFCMPGCLSEYFFSHFLWHTARRLMQALRAETRSATWLQYSHCRCQETCKLVQPQTRCVILVCCTLHVLRAPEASECSPRAATALRRHEAVLSSCLPHVCWPARAGHGAGHQAQQHAAACIQAAQAAGQLQGGRRQGAMPLSCAQQAPVVMLTLWPAKHVAVGLWQSSARLSASVS